MYCNTANEGHKPNFSSAYVPQPKRREVIKHVFVDSRDIDTTSPFEYTIHMEVLKNVMSVELKAISFPKVNGEDYFIFDVDELKNRISSNDNQGSHRTFAICYFLDSSNIPGTKNIINGADFDVKMKQFDTLDSLSKLTIKFKKHGGALIQAIDVNNETQHSFLLEFKVLE